ncbi:EamA family transporter [Nonomuraea sp. WAC 01424]|uniref:DMT family transporter n=1 Tax=Nonomuraea sp. WAC 01424 TaxID=2203200 RepID=UPI000F7752AA|nr:DMT family transporter [Nonomuraea sp. WAC 01424]RSN04220.1 EamA family transporter [Nonomuraea sp. WAC 01424]
MQSKAAGRWLPAFLLLAAIWGNSFFFIKIAVGALHPLQVSFGRMAVGAVTALRVLAVTRQGLPRDPRLWGHFQIASVVLTTLPFTLFAYGEQYVSSVVAAIWNATTPLCTLAFTLLLRAERATAARAAGLGLGFAGVMVVLGVWQPMAGGQLGGSLACFGAALCYGVGGAYMGRFITGRRPEPPVVLAAGQLLTGAVQLAVITLVAGVPLVDTAAPAEVWWSMLGLGGLGTGVAYLLLYWVQARAGVTTTSTVTYLLPVFAVVSGVLVLDETISWNQPVGALVILLAIALTQGALRVPARSALR